MKNCPLCGFLFDPPAEDPAAPACRDLCRCPLCGYETTLTESSKQVRRAVPLSQWPLREEAVVSHLHASDPQVHRRLAAMGILPSSRLCVERRTPSFVFRIGCSRFAVDRELVEAVFVSAPPRETA